MALPILNYKQVVKALVKAGFKIVGNKGSHMRLKRGKLSASDAPRVVIIPRHPEIAIGTLRHIIEQSGMSREEFLALL